MNKTSDHDALRNVGIAVLSLVGLALVLVVVATIVG